MKFRFPIAASFLLAACVSAPPAPTGPTGPQGRRVAGASALFLQLRAGEKSPLRAPAPAGGVLTQRGQCLGVVGSDGRFATAYWPSNARMEVDAEGLVVIDGAGGGRVRLGDYLEFTGGAIPAGTEFQLGDTPIECAVWPGYDGWLAILNPGFHAAPAPRLPAGHLPIPRGTYVERPLRCDEADSLFRYNGAGFSWIARGHRPDAIYPIGAVRQERDRFVASITAPGPGSEGARWPRNVDVIITPQERGIVVVQAFERAEMRLCGPGELPDWASDQAPD
ncbi:MAG TPA: hypothetical protein VF655_03665 [Allosphingosinicella sp.]|jgi:hypothetical protein